MSRSITSVKTFVEYIMKSREDSLSKGLSSYQWFFRGQENSMWSVYPNVFRNDGVAKEHQIIQSALRQNPFEFQNKNDFEILTKLQHYGLGTRLVDVTLNPLVALYFAYGARKATCLARGAKAEPQDLRQQLQHEGY